jgi:outer membrane lipoprotein carrier protein
MAEENPESPMKIGRRLFLIFSGCILLGQMPGAAGDAVSAGLPLNEVIQKVEERYEVPGFTADFYQVSTIQAMEISDEATGKIYVRRPGMMRWEYENPEPQVIIANGRQLWIYRPEDNQVMVGSAPEFFGDGKGAGFLADIKLLRRKFDISLLENGDPANFLLKLRPIEDTLDVSEIHLAVSKSTFVIQRVVTYNPYGDETSIELINSRFDRVPDAKLFDFTIPEGTDVLRMDE